MTEVDFGLAGRVAVVTGGSRGIGEAVARAYVRAGAKVVITGRRLENLEKTAQDISKDGGEVVPIACHMGDLEQIRQLASQVADRFGAIDILVNNAATNPYFGLMIDADERAWEKIMDVNLKGVFFMSQEAAKVMIRGGKGGSIINVASSAAFSPSPMQGIYSISKAGVVALTKAMAKEFVPHRIRVNAIAPGLTNTKFSALLIQTKEILDYALKGIPMNRYAEPAEMVGAALFLASEAASYVTGSVISVDGGATA